MVVGSAQPLVVVVGDVGADPSLGAAVAVADPAAAAVTAVGC